MWLRRWLRPRVLLLTLPAVVALPATASATPTVGFTAKLAPIVGFPHTGNIYGAGTSLQLGYTISGDEYGGYPPPVTRMTISLPRGMSVRPTGFATCPTDVLGPNADQLDRNRCPKRSTAGPVGTVATELAFGSMIAPESATVEPFFTEGGVALILFGHTPVLLEPNVVFTAAPAAGAYGTEFTAAWPTVDTVPGAQLMSITALSFKLGIARRERGKTYYYLRVPKRCPARGFPVGSQLTFAAGGGKPVRTVVNQVRMPCPRRG